MSNAPMGQKDRPWRARISVLNGESTASILAGQPVSMSMSGTADGYSVVLPATATAAKAYSLHYGIAEPNRIDPNNVGGTGLAGQYMDVVVGGWAPTTRLLKATRAASTDAWPSYPAGAIGDQLAVDTVNNAMTRIGSVAQSVFPGVGNLLETYASATTVASSAYTAIVAAAATALTVNVKSWVRCLG